MAATGARMMIYRRGALAPTTTTSAYAVAMRVMRMRAPAAAAAASSSSSSSSSASSGAPRPVPLTELQDSFIGGTSASYLEHLEDTPRDQRHQSWNAFLGLVDGGRSPAEISAMYAGGARAPAPAPAAAAAVDADEAATQRSMRLLLLIRAFQVTGHCAAELDPLGLKPPEEVVQLDPALYGFSEEDMDKPIFVGTWRMKGFLNEDRPVQTLRGVLQRLRETYCGRIGYEYMHIQDRDRCNWLRERIESPVAPSYSKEEQLVMLDRLCWSYSFEGFLSTKFQAAKRFGLEGCETLIPGMKAMIDRLSELGAESVVMGMPHRGRLNVLGNVVRKPLRAIFNEFSIGPTPGDVGYSGSGDVKYHLGTSYDRPTRSGRRVHLSLMANPSHLEAVNPLVEGKTRAKQYLSGDEARERNVPIILHGDGSFSGQGVVYETMHMQELPQYTTGGTIHIVVNNQVAFTTDPQFSRSSRYCTDIAKAQGCPIFHVNGDDVEAVTRVCELAADWRQRWHSDVVIDIVCYRKHGHNEIDEPSFTQPLMYKTIRTHPDAYHAYKEHLVGSGSITAGEASAVEERVMGILQEEFDAARDYKPTGSDWLATNWQGFKSPEQRSRVRNTAVPAEEIARVGAAITALPEGFTPHRTLKRVYAQRRAMAEGAESVDWAMGEALAFGTLLAEGNHVRLSGQDVERGTFSHRHAILHDQKTGGRYCPLTAAYDEAESPGRFLASNSSLSEYGVLGYELGYSMESPRILSLWEAQFGDFANCAQVIVDQFVSSGEAKWLRQSGLVMLLPHGYDGMGPEHSSARLERYLQLVDEDPTAIPEMDREARMQIQNTNMQVCNITTPANYFHALRRQVHREFRKPLVVMSPKNLLRHPLARSPLADFTDDAEGQQRFKRLIMDGGAGGDANLDPAPMPGVGRLVLCSGKVYYDLYQRREELGLEDRVAICRVEQIAPFPFDLVRRELLRYPNARTIWAQEEPMNMGAYDFVRQRILTVRGALGMSTDIAAVEYAGRPPSASTATGFPQVHKQEQERVVFDALERD